MAGTWIRHGSQTLSGASSCEDDRWLCRGVVYEDRQVSEPARGGRKGFNGEEGLGHDGREELDANDRPYGVLDFDDAEGIEVGGVF